MEKENNTKETPKNTSTKTNKKGSTAKTTEKKKSTTATKTVKPKEPKVKEVKVEEAPKKEIVEEKEVELEKKAGDNTNLYKDSVRREITITVIILIFAIIVGFFIGKYLFELMY